MVHVYYVCTKCTRKMLWYTCSTWYTVPLVYHVYHVPLLRPRFRLALGISLPPPPSPPTPGCLQCVHFSAVVPRRTSGRTASPWRCAHWTSVSQILVLLAVEIRVLSGRPLEALTALPLLELVELVGCDD